MVDTWYRTQYFEIRLKIKVKMKAKKSLADKKIFDEKPNRTNLGRTVYSIKKN